MVNGQFKGGIVNNYWLIFSFELRAVEILYQNAKKICQLGQIILNEITTKVAIFYFQIYCLNFVKVFLRLI